ncbi:hypothetical protein NQ318_003738 [Aromia moschata]|uniref:Uncharacterized protein n=1 Tax=Aromia moschata TaxID=1265417 RepID=A0AAV8XF94_9CUCU|nr:hypothetical protein NQ318_003738 [Aromia moschata]
MLVDEVKRQLIISKSKALLALAEMGQQIKDIAKSLRIPIITLKLKENTPSLDGTINFYEIINSGNNLPEHVDDLGEIFQMIRFSCRFQVAPLVYQKGLN